ncbi:MAG: HAD-IIIA family hydrolase [Candidatus Gracilibacteria bacterium]
MKKFANLNVDFRDKIVLLDVDGTLIGDSMVNFADDVLEKITEMKKLNIVYLCTNSSDKKRNVVVEENLGVKIINLVNKKPSKKIWQEIAAKHGEINSSKVIVIGDKFLTDGLFAKKICAKFIKVGRVTSGNERIYIKLFNIVDDFAYNIIKFISFKNGI